MAAADQVWVTRTEPGARETAARLGERGWSAIVAPLLAVHPLAPPPGSDPQAAALAFTSANGVRAFALWWDGRNIPVFAVGDATAAAARAQGFAAVRSAGGDVAALAALIAADRPPGAVLHPCGRERAGDLAGALAPLGVAVETLPVYETRSVEAWPAPAGEALRAARLRAVLLHSPKAARTLDALVRAGVGHDLSAVSALGLSPACIAPLEGLGFLDLRAASRTDEAALLDLLR